MVEKKAIGILAATALAASLAVGCAGTVRGATSGGIGNAPAAHVIRDPENPAYTGAVRADESASMRIVRDPDNPYWSGSTATGSSYAEPVRGPR